MRILTLPSIPRRARLLALPLATLLLPAVASAAHTNNVITVLPQSVLHMKGTSVYCTVQKTKGETGVSCFHLTSSGARVGYAAYVSESIVAIEPGGTTKVVWARKQPDLSKIATFSGGSAHHSSIVDLALEDIAPIGGTRMAVIVTTAKGGGNAMGVVFLDAHNKPVPGAYTAGVSDHFVTVAQLVTGGAKVVYQHAVT